MKTDNDLVSFIKEYGYLIALAVTAFGLFMVLFTIGGLFISVVGILFGLFAAKLKGDIKD